jgi:lipopolysaccharide export system protein LptA
MRVSFLILLSVAMAVSLRAQTNVPASASRPIVPTAHASGVHTNAASTGLQVIEITSDHIEGSLLSRTATYRGNVRVNDPQMKLRSEYLIAVKLDQPNGKYESVAAVTNVVIDFFDAEGQTNHVTGTRAVYTLSVTNSITNELVRITGDPRAVVSDGTVITGDSLTWDCIAKKMSVENGKTVFVPHGTNRMQFLPDSNLVPTKKPPTPGQPGGPK